MGILPSYHCVTDTPAGRLRIESDGNFVTGIRLAPTAAPTPETPCAVLQQAVTELAEYFAGSRRVFEVPIRFAEGTPFRQRVWEELRHIPCGEVATYAEVARRIGIPGGARAVGMGCHANPLLIIVPCHRVVAAHGLGGFGFGLPLKKRLLRLEGWEFDERFPFTGKNRDTQKE